MHESNTTQTGNQNILSLQVICKTYHNNWRERNSISLPTVIFDSGHSDVLFFSGYFCFTNSRNTI